MPQPAGSRSARSWRCGRSWPSWAWSSSTPRRGSCTCAKEARASTSSASITAACAATRRGSRHLTLPRPLALTPGDAARPRPHPGDHGARAAAADRSKRSCRTSTGSCAAGRATSATETPPVLRPDHQLRAQAARAVRRQTPQAAIGYGWWVVAYASPDRLGLINLNGTVVAPTPYRPGAGSRMPTVKNVGEPCAGEPHARIDGAAGGNRTQSATRPRGTRRLPPTRPSNLSGRDVRSCRR